METAFSASPTIDCLLLTCDDRGRGTAESLAAVGRTFMRLAHPVFTLALLGLAVATAVAATAPGQGAAATASPYAGWAHSGAVYLLTTPEGTDLPASASVEQFPLLLRLTSASFDFDQARPNGEDLRFSTAAGKSLAYQIESWDAKRGKAVIWIRIPRITGNAHQRIQLHWGNADVASESSSAAVFNATNGYLTVWHMDESNADAVGTLTATDTGTTSSTGIIGSSRHFAGGGGMNCGEALTVLPKGSSPHSTSVWFRAEKTRGRPVAWGNEQRNGKVQMWFNSPPHIQMDCYFSSGDVLGKGRLAIDRWNHVVHTFKRGESCIYVNGVLDGVNRTMSSLLDIQSPARMYIGGWYGQYHFVGDIDEVRISAVTRSPVWVKLQYENQKPMQSLVGHLVRPGSRFSTARQRLRVSEGRSTTLTAEAGGAHKVSWILKSGAGERIIAVDRFDVRLAASRVSGTESRILQFKAVYPGEIKIKNIPVTIEEAIPDPRFTLEAATTWDGRETLVVKPRISNLAALRAAGAAELTYDWTVSGLAVIKEVAADRLILKRAQNSGNLEVSLTLSNGGTPISSKATIVTTEPATDPWVSRTPGKHEKPADNQFYARNDKNKGTLHCNGTLEHPADQLIFKLYADDQLIRQLEQRPAADGGYAFATNLEPGLIQYRVELDSRSGATETKVHRADNLICGDAYIIEGQSNALATDTRAESPRETNEWIRSYGRPQHRAKTGPSNLWCNPVWKAQKAHKAELGWWGMELAKNLLKAHKIPIFIVNGAVGGTRIDQHQRNSDNPQDLKSIYGRLLWRIRQARLTHGIRAVLWHQGENDQGAAGPTGGYGWETYQKYFIEMSAAWKQDFPNLRRYYVYQIWPNSCSMGRGNGDMLREVQRTLPRLYSNMDVLSTLGVRPPGTCHFPLLGWSEFAHMVQPLIERDFYGRVPTTPIAPPNVKRAWFANKARDAIALEFDQPVVWMDALVNEFYLDGLSGQVVAGSVDGSVITLELRQPSTAGSITYLKEMSWSQERLLIGENKMAALTFCNLSIEPPK